MGIVQTEITLKNYGDEIFVQNGQKKPEDIRTSTVTAIVDTGSMYMVIPEELSQKLGLTVTGEKTAHIANGQRINCKLIEAVKVHWKNRFTVVPAIIIPGSEKVLLGAIALEGMDLMVNPVDQEVVGAHGDREEFLAV
ncbi:aspartyl protease family protein [Treponema sp. R6D11]